MAGSIGELFLRVGLDSSGMNKGLDEAIKGLDSFEGSATRAGKSLEKAFSTVGVKDSAAAVASQIKTLQNSFEFLEKSFKSGKISAEDFAKAQDSIKAKLEQLSGIAPKIAVDVQSISTAFKSIGASGTGFQIGSQIEDLQKNLATLSTAYKQGSISAADFAKAQAAVTAEMDKLTKVPIDKISDHLTAIGQAGSALSGIGASITAAITVPIVAAGAASFKMAADFELAMHKVTSLLGSDASNAFKPLSDGVLELSKRLGIDAVGAANALYEAISAGIPKDNALEFLEVASKAAIAGVTSTKVAVDGMTSAMNAYGLKAKEAGELADAMFQAVNVGKFSFEQLASSMGIASGMAAQLGVSYKELFAAAATITKQGFSVSEAMTMIQSAMTALVKPTAQMRELIKETGAASGAVLLQTKGLEGALNALAKAADGDMTTIATAFGRIEGTKALLALTGKNAVEAAKDLDTLKNSAGAAGAAFDEINKSFSRQLDQFTNSLKATGIELGTALLPVGKGLLESLKPVAGAISELVQAFTTLPAPAQSAVLAVTGITAAVGPMVYVLGQFAGAIPNIVNAVKVFQELAASAAIMEALGTALAIATPLAIAFGVALAAWAVYKAITEIQKLDHQIEQLQDTLNRGAIATKQQATEIELLETALRKAGKEIPSAFDFSGNLKSVQVYVAELEKAATGIGGFTGKAVGASDALKGGTIDISAAAGAYLGLGTAATEAGAKVASGAKATGEASKELKEAKKNLAEVQAAFKVGAASVDDVKAATERVRIAFGGLRTDLTATTGATNASTAAIKVHHQSLGEWYVSANKFSLKANDLNKVIEEFAENLLLIGNKDTIKFEYINLQFEKMGKAIGNFGGYITPLAKSTQDAFAAMRLAADPLATAILKVGDALKGLGVESDASLMKQVLAARANLAIINTDFVASAREREDALINHNATLIALWRKMGIEVTDAEIETQRKLKAIRDQSNIDIEQARNILGVKTTAYYEDQAKIAAIAYAKLKASSDSTQQDILKGEAANYAARLNAIEAHGTRITETQKRQLASMLEVAKEGHKTLLTQWDLFANQLGDSVAKGLDDFVLGALTGKIKSIKDLFNSLWQDIAKSMVSSFISPVTKEIGKWIASTLTGLAGKALSSVLGIGGSAAGAASGIAGAAGGAVSAAGGVAGAAGGATGAAGSAVGAGLSGVMGMVTAVSSAVSAITGIIGLFHSPDSKDLGRIEQNTREMSTVMWRTGAESLQGIAKQTMQNVAQVAEFISNTRDALFDPVATLLAEISAKIGGGFSATTDSVDGVTEEVRHRGDDEHTGRGTSTNAITESVAKSADQITKSSSTHLTEMVKQLAEVNTELAQTKAQLTIDNKALADQLKKNGDKNDPLYLALKAKVDADNALILKDTQTAASLTTAIKGMESAIANAEKGIVSATTASAGGIVDSVTNATNNANSNTNSIIGSVSQSGNEVINALGQTGAEAIAAQHQDTEAMLQQLEAIAANGGEWTTAYSDLKSSIKGVSADAIAAMQKAIDADNAAKAAARLVGMNQLERDGFIGNFQSPGSVLGSTYTGTGNFTGFDQPLAPFVNPYTAPLGGTSGASGFDGGAYVPQADPRTYAPTGGTAYFKDGGNALTSGGIGGRTGTVVINYNGTVTDKEYQTQLQKQFADNLTRYGV